MHVILTFCILIHPHTVSDKKTKRPTKQNSSKKIQHKLQVYFNEFSDLKTACKVCKTSNSMRFKPLLKSVSLIYDALFNQHPN